MKFVTELIGNNNTTCDEMQGGRRQSKIQLVQKESVRSKGRERETKLVIYLCCCWTLQSTNMTKKMADR